VSCNLQFAIRALEPLPNSCAPDVPWVTAYIRLSSLLHLPDLKVGLSHFVTPSPGHLVKYSEAPTPNE